VLTLSCAVSMLEIYNEEIRDLLGDGKAAKHSIMHDSKGNTVVSDLKLVHVSDTEQVPSAPPRPAVKGVESVCQVSQFLLPFTGRERLLRRRARVVTTRALSEWVSSDTGGGSAGAGGARAVRGGDARQRAVVAQPLRLHAAPARPQHRDGRAQSYVVPNGVTYALLTR
jgi:hypothetical protein